MTARNSVPSRRYNPPHIDFIEVRERTSVFAFIFGAIILAVSVIIGRSYAFYFSFILFSAFITLRWKNSPRPWIFLTSIVAACPISISQQQFTCNLILVFWFAVFSKRYFSQLPKWVKALTGLAVFGLFTSSINWLPGNFIGNSIRQFTFVYNLLLPPFILLPIAFSRMKASQNHIANLQGLLFFLIVPSTIILISAKLFGVIANEWEASQHAQSLAEGFYIYQLGKVTVSFLRTQVGFILAALICASTAVAISPLKSLYRIVAGACFISNTFLLLVTGSFGSGFSCICGLSAIFFTQFRRISVTRALGSAVVIIIALFLTYNFLPANVKDYLGNRYEHRVTEADTDRLTLWSRAMDTFLQHPEGVGFTLSVGKIEKTFIHNEYLVYAVSYGLICGLAYILLVAKLLLLFYKKGKNLFDDPYVNAIYLAGLGTIVAIALNTISDHLSANRWYFNVSWSIIWYCFFCSCANVTALQTAADQSQHRNP